jgi:hypothetical protein
MNIAKGSNGHDDDDDDDNDDVLNISIRRVFTGKTTTKRKKTIEQFNNLSYILV